MNHEEILESFYRIATANDWHHHHTPKNLAAAVSVEAAELLAEFQWLGETDVAELINNSKKREQIAGEMADVAMYLLVLADKLKIDLNLAMAQKSQENAQRFLFGDSL